MKRLLLLALFLLPLASASLTDGLIHHWNFDSPSLPINDTIGSKPWTDFSPPNTDPTFLASSPSCKYNGCYLFVPNDDTLRITALHGNAPFTFGYWARVNGSSYAFYSDNTGINWVFSNGLNIPGGFMGVYDGTAFRSTGINRDFNVLSFYLWSFNQTSNTFKLYKNGVSSGPIAYDGSVDLTGTMTVGIAGGAGSPYKGTIDEMFFWNRAFSDSEASELYTATLTESFPFIIGSQIIASDATSGAPLNTFNVTWSNSTINFTNVSVGASAIFNKVFTLFNVTVVKSGYYNNSILNHNPIINPTENVLLSRGILNLSSPVAGFNYTVRNNDTNVLLVDSSSSNSSALVFLAGFNLEFVNLTIKADKAGWTNYSTTIKFNGSDHTHNLLLISNPSILNITVKDESTNSQLTTPIIIQLIGSESVNSSNSTGTLYLDNVTGDDYEIILSGTGYLTRRYYVTVPADAYLPLTLYLLNTSNPNVELILYEVTDENGVTLSNVTVKALRFFVSANAFQLVEQSISDSSGTGGLYLEKVNPKYKFIVESNGNIILTTVPAQIFQSTLLLRADLSEDVIQSLVAVIGISSSVTYNNFTNSFTLTYTDTTGLTDEVCLTVRKETFRASNVVNQTCINGAAGSITLGIGANRTGQYIATATLETNTEFSPALLDQLAVILGSGIQAFGGIAMILTAFLVLGLSMTLIFVTKSAIGGIISVIAGLIIASFIGILSVGTPIIIGVITVGIIVMIITRPRGAT